MKFVFGVHDHQPVGNFDHVVAEIYEQAYRPFLDAVERHPGFRFCLHLTGPLLEWMEASRPEFLDRVAALVADGRVELLGGGFYEPILAAIPERDRLGQIDLMRRRLAERLGAEPRGVWLAERVWEPHLAGTLRRAGVEFALLDDFHFLQAGVQPGDLTSGAFLTDDLGEEAALLPISEDLRYAIPFRDPAETIALCRAVHDRDPGGVLVMVDDGEKFGAWPGTADLVYGRGWLERFVAALAAESDWLELAHPSEILAARPPRRRVYLPPNSYFEMAEWSLPMPAAETFARAVHAYRDQGRWAEMRPFLRGGFWRQFGQKYEESLLMQRRALLLHRDIAAAESGGAPAAAVAGARDHLWRAQCNCAYWHGVFGGLYLPHLRDAVHHHLIRGWAALPKTGPRAEAVTLIGPPGGDVRLAGDRLALAICPQSGAAVIACDLIDKGWNLQNTLRRRREAYHAAIEASVPDGAEEGGGASIHDLQRAVSPEVREALGEDPAPRYSLLDRLLPFGAAFPPGAGDVAAADAGDFAAAPMRLSAPPDVSGGFARCRCERAGSFVSADRTQPVFLAKEIALDPAAAGFTVTWEIRNDGDLPLRCRLASEWNLALIDGATRLAVAGLDRIDLGEPVDAGEHAELSVDVPPRDARLDWRFSDPAAIWIHPVRTASQGEDGFHRTYQGHALVFGWDLELAPGAGRVLSAEFRIGAGGRPEATA